MTTVTLALPITTTTGVTQQGNFHGAAQHQQYQQQHHHHPQQTTASSASFQEATKVTDTRAGQKHVLELKAPRVGHKKSRKGCAQCKRRHVKCNEEAPCANCARHHVPCSLAGGPFVAREDSKRKDRTQSNASSEATASLPGRSPRNVPLPEVVEGGSMSPSSGDQQRVIRASPISPNLQMLSTPLDPIANLTAHIPRSSASPGLINWHLDLQLMHHYMLYTKGVLSEPSDQAYIVHVWKHELPKLAFAHEHVLHALLGLVATHKATVTPDQASYFRTCAVEHIDLAEMQFHQRSEQVCTVEAASARWVYRWLVLLFALGSRQSEATIPSALDGIVDVMALARGAWSPAGDEWYLISQGAFAPVLTRGWQDAAPGFPLMPEGMTISLDHLEYMLELEAMLPHERVACALAIEDLGYIQRGLSAPQTQQHQQCPSVDRSVASVVCWPKRESCIFASMVQRRMPQALIIVSYHCVLLHTLDSKWWARAWGVRVLQDVLLNIDDAWKTWVQWPVQAIMYRETESTSIVGSQAPAMEMDLGAMLL